jgi:hypothetical protein
LKINLFTLPKGSKLSLDSPSSPTKSIPLLRSPWVGVIEEAEKIKVWFGSLLPLGTGVNEKPTKRSKELDEVKINGH